MSISSVSDFPTYNKIPLILKHFCSRLDNVIKSPISYFDIEVVQQEIDTLEGELAEVRGKMANLLKEVAA
jgi:hypothetical protein